jgi:hypothetical protein
MDKGKAMATIATMTRLEMTRVFEQLLESDDCTAQHSLMGMLERRDRELLSDKKKETNHCNDHDDDAEDIRDWAAAQSEEALDDALCLVRAGIDVMTARNEPTYIDILIKARAALKTNVEHVEGRAQAAATAWTCAQRVLTSCSEAAAYVIRKLEQRCRELLIHRLVAGLESTTDREQFLKNAATALNVADLTKVDKDAILLSFHKIETYNDHAWKSTNAIGAQRRGGKRPRRKRRSTGPQPDATEPMYVSAPSGRIAGPEAWLEWKPNADSDCIDQAYIEWCRAVSVSIPVQPAMMKLIV